jgi:hypothetical protein
MPDCALNTCDCIKDTLPKEEYKENGEQVSYHLKGYFLVTEKGYLFFVFTGEGKPPKVYTIAFYDEDAEKESREIIDLTNKELEKSSGAVKKDERLAKLINNLSNPSKNSWVNNLEIVGHPKGNLINVIYGLEIED